MEVDLTTAVSMILNTKHIEKREIKLMNFNKEWREFEEWNIEWEDSLEN